MSRPKELDGARRVVIKIGSSVLRDGPEFDRSTFVMLVRGIEHLRRNGVECVIVCSGAVALGYPQLGLGQRPTRIEELQAAAAVGQSRLMRFWSDELQHYGLTSAQVLLTHDDLRNRRRFLASRQTLRALITFGAIPIINENDTVAIEEIKMGDNDLLSSQVVSLVGADFLIILSDTDGLYDRDPSIPEAVRVPRVDRVSKEMVRDAGGSTSGLGSGGMKTKLKAVKQVSSLGVGSVIARGKTTGVLERLFAGEDLGTWFSDDSTRLPTRKHWIAFAGAASGQIHLDAGAVDALNHHGGSLLPVGVTRITGEFGVGDPVELIDPDGMIVARGLISCDSEVANRVLGIKGRRAFELGLDRPELVHRDDLVLLSDLPD